MNSAAVVDATAVKAGALVAREFRGPGDTVEAAMARTGRRWGIPFRTLWALRYRRPKDVFASVYLAIEAAYEAEVARQDARLREELERTRRMLGDAADSNEAVAAAAALLGKTAG